MKTMQTISRRNCLALGAGAASALLVAPARASATQNVVAELFTSQGCSSCPPADRLFEQVRQTPGVLALTFHVDYWDYLGWKDTLGSSEFSQRQYDYAKARGDMDVYTPQMVVNGAKPLVGSQHSEVFAVIEQSRKPSWEVPVSLNDTPKEIVIELGEGQSPADATLWVMPILTKIAVKIEKGEIAGSELTYYNVVRKLVPAGMWNGKAQRITLPKEGLMPPDCTACVALLQRGKVGPILGCASWGDITA
jgi:hypothetical protein